jgi:hypothetical protein
VTTGFANKGAMIGVSIAILAAPCKADRQPNPIALFSGLDKITAATSTFEVRTGEEVTFGSLQVKLFACFTSPITERPQTSAFVQVFTKTQSGEREKIFSGWMFAESPGLNALENPVYDIWLAGCRDPNAPPLPVEAVPEVKSNEDAGQGEEPED